MTAAALVPPLPLPHPRRHRSCASSRHPDRHRAHGCGQGHAAVALHRLDRRARRSVVHVDVAVAAKLDARQDRAAAPAGRAAREERPIFPWNRKGTACSPGCAILPLRAGSSAVSTLSLFLVGRAPGRGPDALDGPEAGTHHRERIRAVRPFCSARARRFARAVVESAGRTASSCRSGNRRVVEPPSPRVRWPALVKANRGELAVELATEAGVDGILPWRAAVSCPLGRRAARGQGAGRGGAQHRFGRRQAARRPWVPVVESPGRRPSCRPGPVAAARCAAGGASDALAAAGPPSAGDLQCSWSARKAGSPTPSWPSWPPRGRDGALVPRCCARHGRRGRPRRAGRADPALVLTGTEPGGHAAKSSATRCASG